MVNAFIFKNPEKTVLRAKIAEHVLYVNGGVFV